MTVESYMHKYAKIVLASWLRKKIRVGQSYKGLDNFPVPNVKAKSPMYDVYLEYPICKDTSGNIVGLSYVNNENSNTSNKQIACHPWEQWLKDNKKSVSAKHMIPSSFELKKWESELTILHIFDVAIVNSETCQLHSVYEVQHKHPVTEYKKKFIQNNNFKCYEISAEWIMNKVKPPFHVDCITII